MEFRYYDPEGREAAKKFNQEMISLGRNPENDFQIDNITVSGEHATVARMGRYFILTDLTSTNGTFINGEKISKKILHLGDQIRMGGFECRFEQKREPVLIPLNKKTSVVSFQRRPVPSLDNADHFSIHDALTDLSAKLCIKTGNVMARAFLQEQERDCPSERLQFLPGWEDITRPSIKLFHKNGTALLGLDQEIGSDRTPLEEALKEALKCEILFPIALNGSLIGWFYVEHYHPPSLSAAILDEIKEDINRIAGAYSSRQDAILQA